MTNEELCERIQAGETEPLAQLLEQNKGMIHKLARRYLPYIVRRGGAEYDDLVQTAALGMIASVDRWESARGSFLPFSVLYMRRALRELAGIASSKRGLESKAILLPLDEPIEQGNPDSGHLSETVADENAVDPVEACAAADAITCVRAAVQRLPPAPQDAITRIYFNGERWPTDSAARRAVEKGIRLLRQDRRIRALREQSIAACYRNKSVRGFATSWSSSVEDAVLRREQCRAEIERLQAELKELIGQ